MSNISLNREHHKDPNYNGSQTETLELKTTITEMKNSLEELNKIFEQAKEPANF